MCPEIEMNQETVVDTSPATPQAEAPAVEASQVEAQKSTETQAPTPELSLREKIAAKAAQNAEKQAKEAGKQAKESSKATPKPTPETTQKTASVAQKVAAGTPKEVETSTFTPQFKIKVMEQEKEIPEFLRGLLKDEASQKQVHELVTKAMGLDFVVPKLAESRKQAQQFQQERDGVLGQINEVKQLYARGDLDGFFKKLNIPEERILQWVADRINYNQLPVDQKQLIDSRKQAEDRALAAETQSSTLQSRNEQILSQQVQMALETELARPEVKSVAEAFDSRMGKQGAFVEELRRRGDHAWFSKNELVPPSKLVQEMMQFLGPIAPSAPTVQTVVASPAAATPNQTKQAPSVIPNISGRSTSAIKPTVKNIDDIRKRYKEMQASEA
jgi:hypothetical protein